MIFSLHSTCLLFPESIALSYQDFYLSSKIFCLESIQHYCVDIPFPSFYLILFDHIIFKFFIDFFVPLLSLLDWILSENYLCYSSTFGKYFINFGYWYWGLMGLQEFVFPSHSFCYFCDHADKNYQFQNLSKAPEAHSFSCMIIFIFLKSSFGWLDFHQCYQFHAKN